MNEKMTRLREILAEADDLNKSQALLAWDQQAYMPPGGASARAQQMGTLARLAHETATQPEVGQLLDDLQAYGESLDYDSNDAAYLRVARRDYEQLSKVPAELTSKITHASSLGLHAWAQARAENDFSIFLPFLEKNVELSRRHADALGYEDRPYDALVNTLEPGMTAKQLDGIFASLREAIVPLVREIAAKGNDVPDFLHGDFDEHKQLSLALSIATDYGYDLQRGRQDLVAHPFCITFSTGDVRITTRVNRKFFPMALFATLHESGHAMYEQGVADDLNRTPLVGGASLGLHESQSRTWENLVGRSRPFWQHYMARVQEVFPEQFKDVDAELMYRAVNQVQPSLIRVEADEVTYNLHILLRFELENALLDGDVKPADLPEVWNAKMQEYLGITPPSDTLGVLQDMHWSTAFMASFPYYTLGNVASAQIFEKIRADIPDLDEQIGRGEFAQLHGWLRDKLYRHGRKFTPIELMERITGGPLTTGPWIAYVRNKFSELYGLSLD